jgi:hypothetical protein
VKEKIKKRSWRIKKGRRDAENEDRGIEGTAEERGRKKEGVLRIRSNQELREVHEHLTWYRILNQKF